MLEELPLAIAVHRDEKEVAVPSSGKNGGQSGDDDDSGGGGFGGDGDGGRGRGKRGVMEAQLSLPEVVNVNVTHAMVSAIRKKAVALAQDSVTTGARSSSRQPFRVRNRCGEALALTVRRSGDTAEGGADGRGGREEVRFTLEDGAEDTVDFGSFPAAAATMAAGSPTVSGVAAIPVAAVAATTPARTPPAALSSTIVKAQAPRWEPIASSGMSERRCVFCFRVVKWTEMK